jgi:regulator of replication initiation timing
VEVQEQAKNLKHHQEALLEENARIQMENRELRSFFTAPAGQEEHRLASRMRARVEELRDSLAETERQNALPQLPVARLAETVRGRLKGLEETAAYIEKKIREEEQGKVSLEEKDVVAFFEGVLRGRDERLQISREREAASNVPMALFSNA